MFRISAPLLHLKATKAIKAEAEDLRANGTWGGSTGIPVAELRRRARAKGKDIKIAEVFAGIQRRELSPDLQKCKRQIVYRGDSGNVGSVEPHALVWMPDNDFLCRLRTSLSTVPP